MKMELILGAILSLIGGIVLFHYTQLWKTRKQEIPKLQEIDKRIIKLGQHIKEMYEWLRCHIAKRLEPHLDQLEPYFEEEVIKDMHLSYLSEVKVGLSITEDSTLKYLLLGDIKEKPVEPSFTLDNLENEFNEIALELEYLNITDFRKLSEDKGTLHGFDVPWYMHVLVEPEAILDPNNTQNQSYDRLFTWWTGSRKDEWELLLGLSSTHESLIKRIKNK